MTDPEPIRLAAVLRPQTYGRDRPERIQQPVVEPLWQGVRVIAAATLDDAALYEDGEPVTGHDAVLKALSRAIANTAVGVILDGYLTKQVPLPDKPPHLGADDMPSVGQFLAKPLIGIRRNRTEEARKRLEAEDAARTFEDDDIVNFVATDLLWLDGEWLLDVPLLERKRLLEAIIPGDDLVRAGPYVLPPYITWIGSWRMQGFTGVTLKEANSRYRSGELAHDWTKSNMPRR